MKPYDQDADPTDPPPNSPSGAVARSWSERRVRREAARLVADAEAIVAAASVVPSVRLPRWSLPVPFTTRWWVLLAGGWVCGLVGLLSGHMLVAGVGLVAHLVATVAFIASALTLDDQEDADD